VQFYARGHNVFKKETLRRTGIDVEVRQVKHFDAFPARFLWRRQRIRFWLGKPAGEVQRGRRWKPTGVRDEVLANQLKGIRTGAVCRQTSNAVVQSHCTHLAIISRNIRISHYLRKHRAQRRSAECAVAAAGELELLT
jgi:hypothetical protein